MRTIIAVALAAMLGPAAALAQPADERIEAIRARADAAGIPVELLDDKIAEGRAKGVSTERIAEALERRAAGLARAREALSARPDVTPSELAVAADALEAGVSDAVLASIAELAPRDRRAVAIAALDYLVQNGQTPERALERVREALRRGPDALLRLSDRRPDTRPPDGRRPDGVPPDRPDGASGGRPAGVPAPGGPPQGGRPEGLPRPDGEPPQGGRPDGASRPDRPSRP